MTGAVFISHSSRDAALAHELVAALEAAGVACWISSRDVAPGANYQEAIVAAIRAGRALVLLPTVAGNLSDEFQKELSLDGAQPNAVFRCRIGCAGLTTDADPSTWNRWIASPRRTTRPTTPRPTEAAHEIHLPQ